jgi:biopolymer transport protein ExbB
MNPLDQAMLWWRGGDLLMPVMLAVSVVLYAILIERTLVLWGARRAVRAAELQEQVQRNGNARWRAWAARYVALAEAEQLTRGFAVIRALTASLPLLGLLGTVTGMVGTFDSLSVGSGHAASRAGTGISLALTATQYGIALAVPAVLWSWLLTRRVGQLVEHRELVVRQAQTVGT